MQKFLEMDGGETRMVGAMRIYTYLGQVDIGDDHDVDGAGGIFGLDASITTGVVAVLALARAGLPGHAGRSDIDGGFRCRVRGTSAWEEEQWRLVRDKPGEWSV